MTTLYAVSAGSYSDYRVIGIFSSKENAETFMRAFPAGTYDSYNDIEEYELDVAISKIKRGFVRYRVIMYRSGDVREVETTDSLYGDDEKVNWYDKAYWNPTEPWANFYVWAKDTKTAIKIANDRRIAALATETV